MMALGGYDTGKKIKGRKRHIATNTLGHLIVSIVHAANIQDRDGGYTGDKLRKVLARMGDWVLDIVKRSDRAQAFVLLPTRWVVERQLHGSKDAAASTEISRQHSKPHRHGLLSFISAECCEKSLRPIFDSGSMDYQLKNNTYSIHQSIKKLSLDIKYSTKFK